MREVFHQSLEDVQGRLVEIAELVTIAIDKATGKTVWHVERPRSFARRVSEYLSLMVVGPIVIVATFGVVATAEHSVIMKRLAQVEPFGLLLAGASHIAPYVIVVGFFTFLSMFIPNTRVRFAPALIGGLVAGVLWICVGAAFAAFVSHMSNLTLVYASFAILLTALIWLASTSPVFAPEQATKLSVVLGRCCLIRYG